MEEYISTNELIKKIDDDYFNEYESTSLEYSTMKN